MFLTQIFFDDHFTVYSFHIWNTILINDWLTHLFYSFNIQSLLMFKRSRKLFLIFSCVCFFIVWWCMLNWVLTLAANNLEVDALFVYTKTGHMASLLSRCRPDCPIFAFTTTSSVRRRLNLQWGLIPFRLSFTDDMESNLNRTFSLLKARNLIKSGDLVIAVSDMLQSIQVMNVPWEHVSFLLKANIAACSKPGMLLEC